MSAATAREIVKSERGLLPSHSAAWQAIMSRHQAARLPHALLLSGMRGLGKERFADALAQAVLCSQPAADAQACGQCRSCLLYLAGNHPDCLRIAPPEPGKAIPIDLLRGMKDTLELKSQYAGYKVVIISPAEKMNLNAANCLLKTLEEPPVQSLLILVSSQPSALPATLRSRCQLLKFFPPPAGLENQCLSVPGTSPRREEWLDEVGKVMARKSDPVALAAHWMQEDVAELLGWLSGWLMDTIKLQYSIQPVVSGNPNLPSRLLKMASQLEASSLFAVLDYVIEAQQALSRQANVQLLLEDMLIFCSRLGTDKP